MLVIGVSLISRSYCSIDDDWRFPRNVGNEVLQPLLVVDVPLIGKCSFSVEDDHRFLSDVQKAYYERSLESVVVVSIDLIRCSYCSIEDHLEFSKRCSGDML